MGVCGWTNSNVVRWESSVGVDNRTVQSEGYNKGTVGAVRGVGGRYGAWRRSGAMEDIRRRYCMWVSKEHGEGKWHWWG